ncbi:helix-turn-helix domain-containing protein [Schleiferilactobacillus harbinensis]|uniref:helix-turn-helix domain-containing protein n=1 Tax=Schleiferilactobacillus harbinensis TaxID=304207 RepID=UPI00186B03BB|nr:helix-turn-helix transcriptional regulator [Schleiferilactobacillus harbinensis]
MNIYQRIKDLAADRNISIAELERALNFANGSLYKWTKTSPSVEKVASVAAFFGVSVDYLLGRDKIKYRHVQDTPEKTSDPVTYYRIDTAGLDDEDVADLTHQLDTYTKFLKEQLRQQEKAGEQ